MLFSAIHSRANARLSLEGDRTVVGCSLYEVLLEQEGNFQMCRSEIAQLRQQIERELVAMQRGLTGISSGTARHVFIHTRMERIGACQDILASQLGEAAANHIVCNLYMQAMEQGLSSEADS